MKLALTKAYINPSQKWKYFWGHGQDVSLVIWINVGKAVGVLLTGHSEFNLRFCSSFRNGHTEDMLLLMEEILHHLGCKRPRE